MSSKKRLYSVSEAAKILGVSRPHLYTLKAKGLIRFGKLLGRTVVSASEIDRIVSSLENCDQEVLSPSECAPENYIVWQSLAIYPLGTHAIFWIDDGIQAYVVNGDIRDDDLETIWTEYGMGYNAQYAKCWAPFNPPLEDDPGRG